MHEVTLCRALVRLIDEESRRQGFDRVQRVIVEIGRLGHVDPRALEFAFEVAARRTCAEDAVLEMREVPGRAWCTNCADSIALPARGATCPDCGGSGLLVEQGEELRLAELEVI